MTTAIDFSTVTDGSIEGNGYFDTLMRSIDAHIEKKFEDGRLTGTEYAKVYLGAMQAAMSQSMTFALQKNQAEAEADLTREKLDSELLNQEALKAKVRDEQGRDIDTDGNNVEVSDPSTKHYHDLLILGTESAVHEYAGQIATAKKDAAELSVADARGKLEREYGITSDGSYDSVNIGGVPRSSWEAAMQKAYQEKDIAENTAEGFVADTYYKVGKQLQEMMFGLGNAGVIDQDNSTDADGVYSKLANGIETAINEQIKVWDPNASNITIT